VDEDTDTIQQDMWAYFFESTQGVAEGVANGIPWSGNERNHLFFGGVPGFFEDFSGISGIDDPGDGRTFALLDYDRDGRQDVALASPGSPRFRLLKNGIGDRVGTDNNFVALRFVGGNHGAVPSTQWSARDGFGTAVALDLDGTLVFREHQPESGFVGQHSTTMILGMGDHARGRLEVRWLSGKTQTLDVAPARKLVTVFENPEQSPSGEAFVVEDYLRDVAPPAGDGFWKTRFLPTPPLRSTLALTNDQQRIGAGSDLVLIATMATWCVACVAEKPEFDALRAQFSETELAIHAVPVDAEDTAAMLEAWAAKHQPPYEIAVGIDRAEVDRVNAVTVAELRAEAVPATFLTDREGRVLIARWGVPTVSDVRRALWQDAARRGGATVAARRLN
jgi:peroxiredoxin